MQKKCRRWKKQEKKKRKEKQKQNAATWTDNCIYTENAKAKPL
jgi:hypothetical protein